MKAFINAQFGYCPLDGYVTLHEKRRKKEIKFIFCKKYI